MLVIQLSTCAWSVKSREAFWDVPFNLCKNFKNILDDEYFCRMVDQQKEISIISTSRFSPS